MFEDLSQTNSIFIFFSLFTGFALGALAVLFWKKKNTVVEVNTDTSNHTAVPVNNDIEALNEELTNLKQSYFFLTKDYEMALKAMQSLRDQAEEMQLSLVGHSVKPRSASDVEVKAAREKLKNYVEGKLKDQSESMSISESINPPHVKGRISPIDIMDEELVVILANLVKQ